ncbi:hypothetical protein U27_03100 [Candidatus Vecturithrix granuli]|uniref:Uncharacterized protein n=1 Tax=Vecturithrix granuli TaxID=1499967 RepID=A0A081BUY3_VECG1|nr:hypothetical protein U27_03100 [Candidatus Vecturithrix granuli]
MSRAVTINALLSNFLINMMLPCQFFNNRFQPNQILKDHTVVALLPSAQFFVCQAKEIFHVKAPSSPGKTTTKELFFISSLRLCVSMLSFPLHNGNLLVRQAVQRIHPLVNVGFQGAGVGRRVALFGGENLVNQYYKCLLFLFRSLDYWNF